jgi:hypothetical protein
MQTMLVRQMTLNIETHGRFLISAPITADTRALAAIALGIFDHLETEPEETVAAAFAAYPDTYLSDAVHKIATMLELSPSGISLTAALERQSDPALVEITLQRGVGYEFTTTAEASKFDAAGGRQRKTQ